MTTVRIICIICFTGAAMAYLSCSGDKPEQTDAAVKTDSVLIQEALQNSVERWRYGDKAALYDMEFEYYQEAVTYDEYLEDRKIARLQADSVEAMEVYSVNLFEGDSALVRARVIFVGPSGKKTQFDEGIWYHMYFHRGRWIFPTVSTRVEQREWEQIKLAADSAARMEAEGN